MKQATENQASSLEDNLSAYVQGRLDAVTARRIEARAEKNEVFAQKLAFEKRVAAAIADPDASLSLNADSFTALRARVEAPSVVSRIAGFFSWQEPGISWAVPAALLATLAGALLWNGPMLNSPMPNQFETLSDSGDAFAYEVDRDYARVVFSPELVAEQRAAVAGQLGFRIDGEPGPQNSYVVSIPGTDVAMAGVAERWCEDARLMFCSPIVQGDANDAQ